MELTIVDVFAERPLAGNQLAVVADAGSLTDEAMQDIAREMNFSETTFVTSEADERANVRIFTPAWELPFAGHPTLGTAWVLSGGVGEYTLDLEAGAVPVEFTDGVGWMTPPPVTLGADFRWRGGGAADWPDARPARCGSPCPFCRGRPEISTDRSRGSCGVESCETR